MGRVIDHAVAGAGLEGLRAELGRRALTPEEVASLEHADLLVVGALADEVRRALTGDRVVLAAAGKALASQPGESGVVFLRRVAMARLTSRGPVVIDVSAVGLHVAQVALTFGADTWIVPASAKRSLTGVHVDLDALIRRAGRIPEWVRPAAGMDAEVSP